MDEKLREINMLGVKVHLLTVSALNLHIGKIISTSSKALILNVNVNCLNLTFEHPWLRSFLNSAEIVFCDGAGVQLGARILGHTIPERITYAEWAWELAAFAEPRGFSFFFLGGKPGTAQKAADNLRQKYPGLQIACQHGYFDQTPGSPENEAVIAQINQFKPNILMLGMGMPLQERWLMENWPRLDANIALTGGAVFDYVSGDLKRAPRWMTDHGLEWLGRVIIQPRHLWRRYFLGNPLFLWRILLQRFGKLQL